MWFCLVLSVDVACLLRILPTFQHIDTHGIYIQATGICDTGVQIRYRREATLGLGLKTTQHLNQTKKSLQQLQPESLKALFPDVIS